MASHVVFIQFASTRERLMDWFVDWCIRNQSAHVIDTQVLETASGWQLKLVVKDS
jgi:hypothetical protein